MVGDLYRELPGTPPGKSYKSILVIPVYLGDEVVGAVSIDSSKAYHFDSSARDLVHFLMPYIALLAWTLDTGHIVGSSDVLRASDGDTRGGRQ